MKKTFLLKTLLLLCTFIVGVANSVWGEDNYTTVLSLDCASPAPSGTTSTSLNQAAIAEFLNAAAGLSNSENKISCSAKSGDVYSGKGSGGGNIPQGCLKVGKASGPGSFTFTLPNTFDNIDLIEITCYGWKTSSSIKINNGTAQTFTTAQVETVKTFELATSTKTINISVTSSAVCITNITLKKKEAAAAGTTASPTISGDASFLDNTTVTISNDASADGADIYYTLNGDNPTTTTSATCFAYSAPFQVSATTTVKAIAKKSTDTNASSIVSKTFTKITPKTVTEALAAIDALADNGTIAEQYVRGIVSTAGSLNSGAITYYISADGSTSNELQVYKGKGLNNANFTSASEIAVGDEVIVFGTLKKYKSGTSITPEFDQNSYLISKVRKEAPTFSLDVSEKTLDAYSHETVDVTLTTNTDGAITCESNDEDVATVELKSGNVYTITAKTEGTATITIRSAVSENYAPASAEVAVTVTDTRAEAGISFANDAITKTWGENFSGQELTNTNSVTVTWSSTDETVATVNATTGIVNMLKAGTTTIKATYPGDVSYKSAVASYDLTINKATAGITYSENAFEIMLNDDSFVAPTLNNPNSLSGITYSSNNTNLAVVDENTGELWYDSSITGTAIITADFADNDWYKSGSANYTITIIDPTVKGSKYNPYTVAEVIDGTATGDGIYVKGYIVGEYVGKTTDPRVSGFTTDANIAVADPFTTTPTAGASIPVALPSDALKAAWGCKTSKGAFLGYEILLKGNADTYFSVKGIKSTSEVSLISLPITISAAGWATYCSHYPLDFTGIKALTAYTASVEGTKVKFNEVTGKVPANTGLLVSGETASVPVCASANPVANIMEGVTTETKKDAGSIFVLKNGTNGLGFYKNANPFTLRANSAYIPATNIPSGTYARGFISLDDEATAVEKLKNSRIEELNGNWYNLNGCKLQSVPTKKGVYLFNGKKVVVK